TRRSASTRISASWVVSMAVAVIGSVVCIALSLKTPPPLFGNQIEMVENNLPHLPPQWRRQIVGPRLFDPIDFGIQPEFALAVSLAPMNMQRLISLVRVKKEPPASH